jgi:phage baseplate assembly protein gpV
MDASRGVPRWGVVASADPVRHMVRVTLQPEGNTTAWLPVLSQFVGGGWGMVSMPQPGQQVFMLPEYGDAGHPVVIGAAYSAANQAPQPPNAISGPGVPVAPGELALVHQSGACFRLCADGSIYAKGTTFNIDGGLNVHGPITGSGTISTTGRISTTSNIADGVGSLARLRGNYDAHTHTDPQGGTVGTTSNVD